MSVISAGCILWLERLRPVFMLVAAASLTYQAWLVWRCRPNRRTRGVLALFATSLAVNAIVVSTWVAWSLRYR